MHNVMQNYKQHLLVANNIATNIPALTIQAQVAQSAITVETRES